MSINRSDSDEQPSRQVGEASTIDESRQRDLAECRALVPHVRLEARQDATGRQKRGYGDRHARRDYRSAIEQYILELRPYYYDTEQLPELWTDEGPPLATVETGPVDPADIAKRELPPDKKCPTYGPDGIPPILWSGFESGQIAVVRSLTDFLEGPEVYRANGSIRFHSKQRGRFTEEVTVTRLLTWQQLDRALTWADRFAQRVGLGLDINDVDTVKQLNWE